MKIFVGWSGERSEALAQALRDWLPLVLHYAAPWLSETDVAAGQRWADAIAKELEASNFGIICVTRENLASPWIVFEAGSLAKSLQGSRVIPLLLDLEFSEIGGPLAQFQAKKVDQDGMGEVIQSINAAAPQPVQESRAKELFEALWPAFQKRTASIPEAAPAKPTRSQHQILEELVAGVRSLESRFREMQETVMGAGARAGRGRRFTRPHPMLLEEMRHIAGIKPNDPLAILLFASLLRDEAPWLYELGAEAHRAAKGGNPEEARKALGSFIRAADFLMPGPFLSDESGVDSRMLHHMLREFEHFLLEEGTGGVEAEERRSKPKRKRETKAE